MEIHCNPRIFSVQNLLIVFESIQSVLEILSSIFFKYSIDILRYLNEIEDFKNNWSTSLKYFYRWILYGVSCWLESNDQHQEPEVGSRKLFNILDEFIFYIVQRFITIWKFGFHKPKAFSCLQKKILIEAFLSLYVYENRLDLNWLKCYLKSVYVADFAKQLSSI